MMTFAWESSKMNDEFVSMTDDYQSSSDHHFDQMWNSSNWRDLVLDFVQFWHERRTWSEEEYIRLKWEWV